MSRGRWEIEHLNECRLCYPKAMAAAKKVSAAQSVEVRVHYIGPRPERWHQATSDFIMRRDGSQDFTIDPQWGK